MMQEALTCFHAKTSFATKAAVRPTDEALLSPISCTGWSEGAFLIFLPARLVSKRYRTRYARGDNEQASPDTANGGRCGLEYRHHASAQSQ